MTAAKQVRAQYTQEFKLEAVRQVKAGQAIAVLAKVLGIPKASLSNWVRLAAKGKLTVDGAQAAGQRLQHRCLAPAVGIAGAPGLQGAVGGGDQVVGRGLVGASHPEIDDLHAPFASAFFQLIDDREQVQPEAF